MSNTETTGWVSMRTPSGGVRVYHTDPDCNCFPAEEHRRRLETNEIVSRDLRECEVCATNGGCHDTGSYTHCPFCGDRAKLRDHLPCPDRGDTSE